MSATRKRLFQFQKERIETLALDAKVRRGSGPFVILVLDLTDDFAKNIAIAKRSVSKVEEHIALSKSKGVLPCLLHDTSEHDAGVFFEKTSNWESFNDLVVPNGVVRVAIVGDGGVSFATHRIPV